MSAATERRLAALMFTDIVGCTALMAESEELCGNRRATTPRRGRWRPR